jgi:hypothetical protein
MGVQGAYTPKTPIFGPGRPLPELEDTMARLPRDWEDIMLDDHGRYVVVAQRGRGQNALGASDRISISLVSAEFSMEHRMY